MNFDVTWPSTSKSTEIMSVWNYEPALLKIKGHSVRKLLPDIQTDTHPNDRSTWTTKEVGENPGYAPGPNSEGRLSYPRCPARSPGRGFSFQSTDTCPVIMSMMIRHGSRRTGSCRTVGGHNVRLTTECTLCRLSALSMQHNRRVLCAELSGGTK